MTNTDRALSRRRTLQIAGAAAGMSLPLAGAVAGATGPKAARYSWRGVVLGAAATITVLHPDRAAARATIDASLAEIRRLEDIFSLYRSHSVLTRLNDKGVVRTPPPELVELLSLSARIHAASDRAFDPTIQTLWTLYTAHFGQVGHAPQGPAQRDIDRALDHVGFARVAFDSSVVRLEPGMALTLNGIAQGYVADRVAALMRSRGVAHALVNLGELAAIGSKPGGRPWRVGIADPDKPGRARHVVPLADRALATSGDYGTTFDAAGKRGHILDPRSGVPVRHHRSVSVVAPSAALADGLSTALFASPEKRARRILTNFPAARAVVMRTDGHVIEHG